MAENLSQTTYHKKSLSNLFVNHQVGNNSRRDIGPGMKKLKNSGSHSNLRNSYSKMIFVSPNISYSNPYSPVVSNLSMTKIDQNESLNSNKLPNIHKEERKEDMLSDLRKEIVLRDSQLKNLTQELNETRDLLENNNSKSKSNVNKTMNLSMENSAFITPFLTLEKDNPQKLIQILLSFIQKNEELYKLLELRCGKMEELMKTVTQNSDTLYAKELEKIKLMVLELNNTLLTSSKNEIELGLKQRELERKYLELTQLEAKYKKLWEIKLDLENRIDVLNNRRKDMEDEFTKMHKQFLSERKSNGEYKRKIEILEKRIQFILDSDLSSALTNQDKLRVTLTELMKENEANKRELTLRDKEIARLKDKINGLDLKIKRLSKKIDNLRKNKDYEEAKEKALLNSSQKKLDPLRLLANNFIPSTLDFRVTSLKTEYFNLLSDIAEHGSTAFAQHFMRLTSDETKKEEIILITSQFLSFKEFSEKLNWMVIEISRLNKVQNDTDLMISINKNFIQIFQTENIHLWLFESNTGLLRTVNNVKKEKKCLINKGLFGDVLKNCIAINRREIREKVLYQEASEEGKSIYVDSAMVFPVIFKGENKIRGIIEISSIENTMYGFDDEYFGILMATFISRKMKDLLQKEVIERELKFKDRLYECFLDFMISKSKYELSEKVYRWAKELFGVSSVLLYLLEDNKLKKYTTESEVKTFNIESGLAGFVAKENRSMIVNDIKNSAIYNKLLDLNSILPVLGLPLSMGENKENFGVLEIVLKNKVKGLDLGDDITEQELDNNPLVINPFDTVVKLFTNTIVSALNFLYRKVF